MVLPIDFMFSFFFFVSKSMMPVFMMMTTLSTFLSFLMLFNSMWKFMLMMVIMITMQMLFWSYEVIKESYMQGLHNFFVMKNLKLGMMLFIFSEVMFFFAFFWTLFDSSLTPNVEIGMLWPSYKMNPLNPFLIPFLNTLVLLSSGFMVTMSHFLLILNKKLSMVYLIFTILLGIYFTSLQAMEYKNLSFTIMDSIFGSTFFLMTGFHGLHVLVGTILLIISLIRMYMLQFNKNHHVGFELAIWYWHFVDVVWLFLFVFLYWWSYY